MALTVVTWNVNSVRFRLDVLARVVERLRPDILCLQETKVTDDLFPHVAAAALGFDHRLIHGMKGYNGVAILSRLPLTATGNRCWVDRTDCRHVFAEVQTGDGRPLTVHSLYVPAGGDDPDPGRNPKFAHKLKFLDAMADWSRDVAAGGGRHVLTGDLNVAPLPADVWDHARLSRVVTHTPAEVSRLTRAMEAGGWVDAVRRQHPEPARVFTWWSYRAADWRAADKGRRLDHIWVSADLGPRVQEADVLLDARDWAPASDHAPVRVCLDL
jgi:exodeoxyribonuclease-3